MKYKIYQSFASIGERTEEEAKTFQEAERIAEKMRREVSYQIQLFERPDYEWQCIDNEDRVFLEASLEDTGDYYSKKTGDLIANIAVVIEKIQEEDDLYMFIPTGTVKALWKWEYDFMTGDNDDETTWAKFFELLIEVVPNIEGEEGYKEDSGEWREAE